MDFFGGDSSDLKMYPFIVLQSPNLINLTQLNACFLFIKDNNYERIIKTSATQIEYLFGKLEQKSMNAPLQQMLTS